jgi:hypothetical protein
MAGILTRGSNAPCGDAQRKVAYRVCPATGTFGHGNQNVGLAGLRLSRQHLGLSFTL